MRDGPSLIIDAGPSDVRWDVEDGPAFLVGGLSP